MKKLLLAFLLCSVLLASAGDSALVARAKGATAVLILDNHPVCTAAAFDRVKGGTLFLTAGHCLQQPFLSIGLLLDEYRYEQVFVVKAGDPTKGEDFAVVLLPHLEYRVPVLSLGASRRLTLGARLFAITAPYGGPLTFTSGELARKVVGEAGIVDGLIWQDYMLVRMEAAPGASGSAVIDYGQAAIVGILVGRQQNGDLKFTVVLQVEQFREFLRGKKLELQGAPVPIKNTTRAM